MELPGSLPRSQSCPEGDLASPETPAVYRGGLCTSTEALLLPPSDVAQEGGCYREFFEMSSDGLFITDAKGHVLEVNQAGAVLLGVSCSTLIGRPLLDFVTSQLGCGSLDVLAGLLAQRSLRRCEAQLCPANGEPFPVVVTLGRVRGTTSEPEGFVWMIRDLAENKRVEEEMRSLVVETENLQRQKLESLGMLAGGIAHDFNNIFGNILLNAHLAQSDLPVGSGVRDSLVHIESAVRQAAELASQMLAYAGKGKLSSSRFDLAARVAEIGELLRASLSRRVSLELDLPIAPSFIKGDPSQIQQIVMNLITNSAESIGERTGCVSVAVSTLRVDEAALAEMNAAEDVSAGSFVRLVVADNGCGMTQEVKERIFDPFFSTKFTGRGLGLAAAQGIVRSHQGALKVWSEPGEGTRIEAFFPVAAPEACVETRSDVCEVLPWRGGRTVLVVDDNEHFRITLRAILEQRGFAVLTAADGQEGVELFQENAEEIGAVILDLIMPRVSGEEAYRRMRALRPEVKVILVSGYSEQEASRYFREEGPAGFLMKPFAPRLLEKMLQEVLGEQADLFDGGDGA